MITSKNATDLKFVWPTSFGDGGISEQDRKVIEKFIEHYIPKESNNPSSGYAYSICKKKS
jgi:hypothetical protein